MYSINHPTQVNVVTVPLLKKDFGKEKSGDIYTQLKRGKRKNHTQTKTVAQTIYISIINFQDHDVPDASEEILDATFQNMQHII